MALIAIKRDKIEILDNGVIQVRTTTEIHDDDDPTREVIGSSNKRLLLEPGDSYAGQNPNVHSIIGIIHTPEKKAEYKESRVQRKA